MISLLSQTQLSVVMIVIRPTKTFVIVLLACRLLLLQTASTLRADCGREGYAIEDTDHVISCNDLPPNATVGVRLVIPSHPTDIGTCDAARVCLSTRSIFELSRPNATFVTVTVKQVQRDGANVLGSWRFIVNNETAECTVSSVIYPPVVRAVNVTFDENLKATIGVLEVTKVYPKEAFKCIFEEKAQELEYAEIPATYVSVTETAYTSPSNQREYYRYVCKLQKPLPEKEGVYQYKVTVFPQSRSINVNGTFLIRRPKIPTLPVQRCRNDFVDLYDATQRDAALCTCVTEDLGAPPGDVQWLDPDGTVLQIPQTDRKAITLRASDVPWNRTEQDYTCIVRHHTGDLSITFQPNLAFGPKFVVFPEDRSHSVFVPFKYGEDVSYVLVLVVCRVNPEPTMSCENKPKDTQETGFQRFEGFCYKNTFTIRPEPGDNGRVINCTIENKYAPSVLRQWATTTLTVYYPPPDSPTIDYSDSKVYVPGDILTVTCKVKGGNPLVDQVTFSCEDRPADVPSLNRASDYVSSTLVLTLKKEDHGKKCKCSANHVISTYNRTTSITLIVSDPGSIHTQHGNILQPSTLLLFTSFVYAALIDAK